MSGKESDPYISVIIPVNNSSEVISNTLDAVLASECEEMEVIVVDDASTDNTVELCRRRHVKVIEMKENKGPSAARNEGIRTARGEVVLFLDDDAVIKDSGMISDMVGRFKADPELISICTISEKKPENKGFLPAYTSFFEYFLYQKAIQNRKEMVIKDISTRCGSIRKEALEEIGGFNTKYRIPSVEDAELLHRILDRFNDGKFLWVDYRIGHYWPEDIRKLLKNYFLRSQLWTEVFIDHRKFVDPFISPEESLRKFMDCLVLLLFAAGFLLPVLWIFAAISLMTALILKKDLFKALNAEYGFWFTMKAAVLNFVASIVLGSGIMWGTALRMFRKFTGKDNFVLF